MRLAVSVAASALALITVASAQSPYDDEKTPTGWAWAQIRAGEAADFGKQCGELDPGAKTGWDDPCRRLSPQFLVDVLSVPKWRDQVMRRQVRLRGVRIDGAVDLSNTEVTSALGIDASRIDGALLLADSRWERPLILQGSTLAGNFSAARMHTESDILLVDHTEIEGYIDLNGAYIRGALKMQDSSFQGVSASHLGVGGSLLMNNHTTFGGDVILRNAKIGANLNTDGSSFAKTVDADGLTVGSSVWMRHSTFASNVIFCAANVGRNLEVSGSSFSGGAVADPVRVEGNLCMDEHAKFGLNLRNAKIGANLDMDSSSFANTLDADGLTVGNSLWMRNATFAGDVILRAAKVGSNLEMDNSSFSGAVMADPIRVEGNLFMRDGATFRREVVLIGAKIGGNLHLYRSTAWQFDLSGLDTRELLLFDLGWSCADSTVRSMHWRLGDKNASCGESDPTKLPKLILRNTHVDAFQDNADAWPPVLDLEGFHYDRIGGIGGTGRDDMRGRSSGEWTEWFARDGAFSTQPYTELSSVLVAAGHRDTAEAIQFAGRQRERREAWGHGDLGSWAWLTFLSVVAGYGIGLYTFRVLWWVLGLTLLGAIVLRFSPNARRQGFVWRLGASLHRLLPLVELSKEFKDFFENPPPQNGEPRNLNRLQTAYFAGQAIAGWVLGFFLLAAMGGLTQKS